MKTVHTEPKSLTGFCGTRLSKFYSFESRRDDLPPHPNPLPRIEITQQMNADFGGEGALAPLRG
jgi:hypothetical protein